MADGYLEAIVNLLKNAIEDTPKGPKVKKA